MNPEHKDKRERFRRQVEALGGKNPIVEWTPRSGLLGYDYEGQIYRWRVQAPDVGRKMVTACHWALAEITGRREGIVRTNGQS